jgi:L-seryl-tRNA(Ser) seleniumtransferase
MAAKSPTQHSALSALPSVDALLRTETARALLPRVGVQHLTSLARKVADDLRREILADGASEKQSRATLLAEAERRLGAAHEREVASGLRRVINATGVILHTNLGRAPLSDAARRAIADEAARYCTLELDIYTGTRGARGVRVEELLCTLTGAEAALVVNNCAAAALLILRVLASDGETILSRGELVEIGGDFRVPDVMASSGTQLIEVGTTNRTRLSDYSKAINERTRLLMRVHTSNYRIVGFTNTPNLRELADLAHKAGLPLYEDAGSGALVDFAEYGITGEPLIAESIDAGADVISFSGDKLLGGPQAGLVVGRKEIVQRLKAHPMYRALRADKLALAALEATLDAYRRGVSFAEVPAHRMIAMPIDEIRALSLAFIDGIRKSGLSKGLKLEIMEGKSAIGGGSGPTSHPPTVLISISHQSLTPDQIESTLRHSSPPVIARIADDRVLLDLRTVAHDEVPALSEAILALG